MSPTKVMFLYLMFLAFSEGFDLTLLHNTPDDATDRLGSSPRQPCAWLQCSESLADAGGSRDQLNQTRQLSSLNVYKARVGGDGTREPWQRLASLTPRQPSVDRVSDAMKVTGQLGDQKATISVKLFKAHDCHESQFSCVVASVDHQGQSTVKQSLVGQGLNTQAVPDIGPQFHQTNGEGSSGMSSLSDENRAGAAVMQFLGLKLDSVHSGLGDSLKRLENRLEDKLGDQGTTVDRKLAELDRSVEWKLGALDLKIASLQNRLEDKLVEIDRKVDQALGQNKPTGSADTDICEELASKLDVLVAKQVDNRKQLNECVAKVTKLSGVAENRSMEKLFTEVASLSKSLKFVAENISAFDDRVGKLETDTGQCTQAVTGQSNVLTSLVSSASDLTHNTNTLVSMVGAFKNDYGGGSLVPVDEYFDLLDTGKKEWRLAFRGTPYIDVKIYPAYIHGTGIPVEVEEGCKQFNQSLPCSSHYRNKHAFDNWVGIDQVMFAVFKGDNLVHRVIFNGKRSSPTTWFSPHLVLDSSWRDLTSKSHTVFSLAGEVTTSVQRRFFMNFDYQGNCAGFRGWFYAHDLHDGCPADRTLAVPMFRYATGDTLAVYASADSSEADAIGVFLKYE